MLEGTISGPDLDDYVVRVGQGEQPETWTEIARSSKPVEDGPLATWSLAGVAPGAWVIHVEARATDGRLAHEYIPVSTESLQFAVLSSDGPAAERPAIAGGRVVWQSRRGRVEDQFGRLDYDLFENDFFDHELGGGEERRLLERPGDQTQPAISRVRRAATVSWLDQAPEASESRAYACRVDPLTRRCEPISLAPSQRVTLAPAPLRDRIYWLDGSSGELDVRSCWLDRRGSSCRPFDPGLEPARRGWLEGDGRNTLTWSAVSEGSGIALCRVGLFGSCRETLVAPLQRAFTRSAASGDLVVWVDARFFGDRPLLACIVAENGDCEPITIVPHAEDARPRVSGDVVVWEGTLGDEAGDVFFCEFDRLRQRCPVQRLTSELSSQSDADIDGRRIVWVDERFGPGRVAGLRLPAWREIRERKAHVGRPMTVVAWLDGAGHGPAVRDGGARRGGGGSADRRHDRSATRAGVRSSACCFAGVRPMQTSEIRS